MMAQYLALAILLAVYLVHLSYVDSEARTFGPPSAPDPDNPDPQYWIKQALKRVRNCPRRRGPTVVNCQPLPAPNNGTVTSCTKDEYSRVTTDRQPVRTKCDVACDGGYTLSGFASRICLENGTWNGTDAKCTGITCAGSDLPAPVNGTKGGCNGDYVSYGGACTMSCNTGYKPISAVQITCGSDDNGNGVWSADTFNCTGITCASSDLPAPVNGTKGGCNGDYVSYSGACTMSCNTGYKPISAVQITCGSDDNGNGVWSADTFNCTAIQCAVNGHLDPVNGIITGCSGSYISFGESCMFSCDQGFKPTTSMEITCTSDDNGDGVWSTMCTQITCAIRDLPVSTSDTANCLQQEHAMYGTTFTLACNDNTTYGLISCTSDNGTWSTSNIDGCADEWLVYKHVGLEYRSIIPDDRLAASSRYYDSNGYHPAKDGRLNNNWRWCAALRDSNQWIEVDLVTSTVVSGVITQGSTMSQSRTTQYQVAYQTTSSPTYVHAHSGTENIKTFSGNLDDGATPVIQFFTESFNATRVKIEPLDWYTWPCLRFELLGCRLN